MSNKKDRINPLDVAIRQVDIAAERLKLDLGVREKIKQTKREGLPCLLNKAQKKS
jgi:hypothetical protein